MEVNLLILCSSLQFHAMPLKITLVRFHLGAIDTVFLYSDNVASLLSLGIFFSFQSPLYKNVSFKVFLNSFLSNSSCAWLKIAWNVALSLIHVFSIMEKEQSRFLLSKFMSEMNIRQFGFSTLLRLMCKLCEVFFSWCILEKTVIFLLSAYGFSSNHI